MKENERKKEKEREGNEEGDTGIISLGRERVGCGNIRMKQVEKEGHLLGKDHILLN
jgi:hypothetical protein